MESELVKLAQVPFYGDVMDVTPREDGRQATSIKRICESIGVDFSGQLQKLKGCTWAGVEIISTPDERGRPQQLAMIDIESLPMCLVTISPSKVAAKVRPKLERYQREAKAVLAAWFLGRRRGPR